MIVCNITSTSAKDSEYNNYIYNISLKRTLNDPHISISDLFNTHSQKSYNLALKSFTIMQFIKVFSNVSQLPIEKQASIS